MVWECFVHEISEVFRARFIAKSALSWCGNKDLSSTLEG